MHAVFRELHISGSFAKASITTSLALLSCACLFLLGCGQGDRPKLGRVTGVVRVDGQPKAGLILRFFPTGLRSSTGYTNEYGAYELRYIRDIKGAAVGKHKVTIETLQLEGQKPRPQLPDRYNFKSELTREVGPGSNTIDFNLESI